MHLLLYGVNNYSKSERMTLHSSATEFIKNQNTIYPNYCREETFAKNVLGSPECLSEKEVNLYTFENKKESYIKNGEIIQSYTRTACVDKKWKVFDIVKKIFIESKNPFCHLTHVVNVSNIFQLIKDSFKGK